MSGSSFSTRDSSLDLIRVVATLAVVSLHSDQITLSTTNYVGGKSWWVVLFINTVSRTAVPLFVMLSGCLLLEKYPAQKYSTLATKTLYRILLPLISWSFIYLGWRSYYYDDISPELIIDKVLSGDLYHLYFLYALAGLYLTIPIWIFLTTHYQKQALVSLSVFSVLLTIVNYFVFDQHSLGNGLFLFVPYACYFLAGNTLKPVSTRKAITYISLALGLSLLSGVVYYFSLPSLNFSHHSFWWTSSHAFYLWDAFSPTILISTFLLWIGLRSILTTHSSAHKWLSALLLFISIHSYGIYLIHPIILDLLDRYGHMTIHLISGSLLIHYFKKVFLAFIYTLLVSFLFSRAKLLRPLIGQRP